MSIALPVYLLCACASILVGLLLFLNYRRTRVRFLLWSSLCFLFFAANNVLLFLDMVILVDGADLSVIRTVPALAGILVLLYGFIWDVT